MVWIVALGGGAGCSGDDPEPSGRATTATVLETTAATKTTPEAATTSSSDGPAPLPEVAGPPEPLNAGAYRSPDGFSPQITFAVPAGWYGGGGSSGFAIGSGLDRVNEDFARVGLFVYHVDLPVERAQMTFGGIEGLDFTSEEATRIGGASGTTYTVSVRGERAILEPLGVFADIPRGDAEVSLVAVDGETLLISLQRWKTAQDRDEGRRVVESFRITR